MSTDKSKSKIRLIVKRNNLIRNKDGDVITVTSNYETQDYELKNSILCYQLADNENRKYEIVSAEFVD